MSWLAKGEIVDVIAPGFRSTPEELNSAIQHLNKWGLVAQVPANIIGKHFLCSNDDEIRFEHLEHALYNEDTKVIWCLRGGYGSIRLLPRLAKLKKPKTKKLLMGISDITSLHLFLNQEWGWPTLHSSLLDRVGLGRLSQKNEKEIHDLLFGKTDSVEFKKLKPLNSAAKKNKTIKGSLIGGNLTVLQSSLGTPFEMDLKNKILAIEDLGERGYRIDRIFEHFEQCDSFKGCKGLLIGEFLGGEEPNQGAQLWKKVFIERAQRYEFPVFSGLEIGHGYVQRPLPFGTNAILKSGAKASLTVDMV